MNRRERRRQKAQLRKSNIIRTAKQRSLTSGVATSSVAAALMFASPQSVHAQVVPSDPQCVIAGNTVTCSGNLAAGIDVVGPPVSTLDTLIVELVDPPGITPAAGVDGISFMNNAAGNITVDSTIDITTTGDFAAGVAAQQNGGDGNITITSDGTISTVGDDSDGILAEITTNTAGTISVTNYGAISTIGIASRALKRHHIPSRTVILRF